MVFGETMICLHCEEMKRQRDEARAARHQVEDSFAKVNAERDDLRSEYANLCRFATSLESERDELKAKLQFTNSNWPHEKKALEQLVIVTKERDALLQHRKDLLEEIEVLKAEIQQCGAHRWTK